MFFILNLKLRVTKSFGSKFIVSRRMVSSSCCHQTSPHHQSFVISSKKYPNIRTHVICFSDIHLFTIPKTREELYLSCTKMGKFLKPGRVVILLNGRFAGKKAVCVKTFDDGSKARTFGHCLVAGVQKAPLKVTKAMSKKKLEKRYTTLHMIFVGDVQVTLANMTYREDDGAARIFFAQREV